MRRLILLLSVGWLPPDLHPSGACLALGTSMPVGLLTPLRVAPKPGLRLFRYTLEPVCSWEFNCRCVFWA
jgi:hypothetical protein